MQSRRKFLQQTTIVSTGLIGGVISATPNAKKMVIHHVFFWLVNPASKEDLAKLIAGLQTLKAIKAVKNLRIGVPAATEQRSVIDNSYSASELMFFEDLAAQKSYQDDPIHQKFIADCSHLWSKVVVYDSVDV